MLKISIVTACLNNESTIEKTLKSVAEQHYSEIEYIIVDGGSTDNTMNIIHQYSTYIDILISESDKGVYDAFNKGINRSTGDIIYFLNSDDYLKDPDVIQDVANIMNKNTQLDFLYGNIEVNNPRNGYLFKAGREFGIEDYKQGLMPPHPGFFAKRKLYTENEGFDLQYKIAADFDLTLKMFLTHGDHSVYMNRTIAVFNLGGLSTMLGSQGKIKEEMNHILQKHFPDEQVNQADPTLFEHNMTYYKKWLESLLLFDCPISQHLFLKGIKSVALFGSMEMSLYVIADLKKAGIHVEVILDNSSTRQGIVMNDIKVVPPQWLQNNEEHIDAIILSFEGPYDEVVSKQIRQLCTLPVLIYSWKDLIMQSMRY